MLKLGSQLVANYCTYRTWNVKASAADLMRLKSRQAENLPCCECLNYAHLGKKCMSLIFSWFTNICHRRSTGYKMFVIDAELVAFGALAVVAYISLFGL